MTDWIIFTLNYNRKKREPIKGTRWLSQGHKNPSFLWIVNEALQGAKGVELSVTGGGWPRLAGVSRQSRFSRSRSSQAWASDQANTSLSCFQRDQRHADRDFPAHQHFVSVMLSSGCDCETLLPWRTRLQRQPRLWLRRLGLQRSKYASANVSGASH